MDREREINTQMRWLQGFRGGWPPQQLHDEAKRGNVFIRELIWQERGFLHICVMAEEQIRQPGLEGFGRPVRTHYSLCTAQLPAPISSSVLQWKRRPAALAPLR